jgi:hypothetical protein
VRRVHVLHVVVQAVQEHVPVRARVSVTGVEPAGGTHKADDPETKNERHHQW